MLKALRLEIVKEGNPHPLVQILLVVLGIVIAFLISALIIDITGKDPVLYFTSMFNGAFGEKRKIYETLLRGTPLILTGLATVISFKAQIWSIGQEGQLLAGAMLTYWLYTIFQPLLIRPVLLAVLILGGFLGGALVGWLAGWMRARYNVDIIISTVLLNYIVLTVLQLLIFSQKYWMDPTNYYPRTPYLEKDAWYPIITQDARLHLGFLIAIGLAVLVYWVIKRTPYGYDLRSFGANPTATEFKGINVNKLIIVTMFISGGLAGLAGAGELLGVHHNLSMNISPGYGYTGIIVAMVSELNPLFVVIVGILFGGLINGSVVAVTTASVHSSIMYMIQALVLISVLLSRSIMKYRIRRVSHVS